VWRRSRYGDAADALVAVAIVLREIADPFEHESPAVRMTIAGPTSLIDYPALTRAITVALLRPVREYAAA